MPYSTYSELIAAVVDEMKDSTLEDKAPDFIRLAEAQFNRQLFTSDSEATQTTLLASGTESTAMPSDFRRLRSLFIDSEKVLAQLSPDDFRARWIEGDTGIPETFAIIGTDFHWGPIPDSDYTVTCVYVQGIPLLSETNTTNWLLEDHPDLYLYGALRQAELYGWNDERGRQFDLFVDSILGQIRVADAIKRQHANQATIAGSYF